MTFREDSVSDQSNTHHWLCGGRRADRLAILEAVGIPAQLVPTVDAHRRLRGPYTAAGTVVRALVPAQLTENADLVRRHDLELLSVAPELSASVPNSRETLTSMAIPKERTRFYARLRTKRISNGLVEFVRDSLPGRGPWALVFENVEHAEETDLEFLAALLRRLDPDRLTVVVCTGEAGLPDGELRSVVGRRAQLHTVSPSTHSYSSLATWAPPRSRSERRALGWLYISTDCTSDDPHLRRAYQELHPADMAQLHERRASELIERAEPSLALGAIPFHLERGRDPHGAGVRARYAAQDHCLVAGFYSAVVEYGYRGLDLVDSRQGEDQWWMFAIELGLALSILSRTKEAEALYDQARLRSTKPAVHMAAAYSTAMLYTRHNALEERNDQVAKAWLHAAIATASLLPDRSERAFQSAFYKNGLALVEVNLGEPSEALRLVDECIDGLDQELAPDEHRLHRSVLKNNRARVYLSLGRLDEALADYAVVIREDPNHAEHYLERGNILRRLGRTDEAQADYERALLLSPPFPEIYYNRGDLRAALGDMEGAIGDFSYVVELEPEFVDAYVNRAGLYLEIGETEAAYDDATRGLVLDPNNAYFHDVVAHVHAARGEEAEARAAFERALKADATLISALSGRATLAYEAGDLDAAIADLGEAIELKPGDPALLYNRAFALQGAGRWDDALADLEVAAALAPDDPDITAAQESCLLRVGLSLRVHQ
jgi:tetratricopeptide (TPR) repeat protein